MNKNNSKTKIVSKEILIDRIRPSVNCGKSEIKGIIDRLLDEINKALVAGEEIRFKGSFTLKTDIQKERVAMNLQTKKKMTVPAKRVPKCRFSADLKEKIAKGK